MPEIRRIAFFGTPAFAVPTLAALVAAGRAPSLVVTQPARPVGRGGRVTEPPVATWAREHGLAVAQPEKVRDPAFLEQLEQLAPDLAVVVAFGQIFPRRLLAIPRLGCVNVHASLLPRWRGAAPIQAAIAAGDPVTGVTTMQMVFELDAGPMLLSREVPIGAQETAGELAARLAELGAQLLVETVDGLERGALVAREQNPAQVTFAGLLSRQDGQVDWTLPASRLFDRLRAYTPWPGLTAQLDGRPVKIVAARVAAPRAGAPGTVIAIENEALVVACGEGTALALTQLQRPGRGAVSGAELFRGERLAAGARFEVTVP
ncbi:MAG TPA: methionyl-tRNA formyltransferase [Thermoanaerobaculia bacterium]|nr:methionyl-tRNA formyltransferase [Thermoanaerobaculia bacterium]